MEGKRYFAELTLASLEQLFIDYEVSPSRVPELLKPYFLAPHFSVAAITTLPRGLVRDLDARFRWDRGTVNQERIAGDGTRKFLFRLPAGGTIETVRIPFPGRHSLCLSTQQGCRMACRFCHTARMGLRGNLSAMEMLLPLAAIVREAPETIRNILFMGMGEPLDNLPNLVEALKILCHPAIFHFSPARVTVSTIGLLPELIALDRAAIPVRLNLSLGSAIAAIRDTLLPNPRKMALGEIATLLPKLQNLRDPLLACLLIEGVTDGSEAIAALRHLAVEAGLKINLIPYNPIPGSPFAPSTNDRVNEIWRELRAAGVPTRLRLKKGLDILAACGQLNSHFSGTIPTLGESHVS